MMITQDIMAFMGSTIELLLRSGMVNGRKTVRIAMIFVTGDLLVDTAEVLSKYKKIKRM